MYTTKFWFQSLIQCVEVYILQLGNQDYLPGDDGCNSDYQGQCVHKLWSPYDKSWFLFPFFDSVVYSELSIQLHSRHKQRAVLKWAAISRLRFHSYAGTGYGGAQKFRFKRPSSFICQVLADAETIWTRWCTRKTWRPLFHQKRVRATNIEMSPLYGPKEPWATFLHSEKFPRLRPRKRGRRGMNIVVVCLHKFSPFGLVDWQSGSF